MRLGDLDALSEKMKGTNRYFDIKFDIDEMPTIDPETLPIVKELRAENKKLMEALGDSFALDLMNKLDKLEKERDELASFCGKLVVLCDPPQKWRQKLFRRHQGTMIGDYMGSGYPFVDDFNRIWSDFEETASDGAYSALRKYADAAALEKKKKEGVKE